MLCVADLQLITGIFRQIKICRLHNQLFISIMGPGLYGRRKILTFNFQSTLKDNGNASAVQSKYTSAPSSMASDFKEAPKLIRACGKSKNINSIINNNNNN